MPDSIDSSVTPTATPFKPSANMAALRRARRAMMLQFFVCGAAFAAWGIQIPLIKARYDLSDAVMSLAMLALAGGAILAMGRVGRWVSRVGSAYALRRSGVAFALTTFAMAIAPGFAALLLILVLLGMAMGAFDVAMNVQAATLETRSHKPLMSTLHGMFSVGGMFGAGSAGLIIAFDLPAELHAALIAGLTLAAALLATNGLLTDTPARPESKTHNRSASRVLWMLGLAAFLGLVCEGAMYDWAGIYLRDVADAPLTLVSYGYAAFCTGMAAARFAADPLRRHISGARMLSASAWLGFVGIALVVAVPSPLLNLGGFLIMGLGAANLMPLFILAGTRQPGVPAAEGVAFVARCAYGGMLLGPVLIGAISHYADLRIALAVVALIMGWIAAFGTRKIHNLD